MHGEIARELRRYGLDLRAARGGSRMRGQSMCPGDHRRVLHEASVGGVVVGRKHVDAEPEGTEHCDVSLVLSPRAPDVNLRAGVIADAVGVARGRSANDDASGR